MSRSGISAHSVLPSPIIIEFTRLPPKIMPGKTLLLLGSGPGIGVSVASAFAVRGFTHIALVSRHESRLKEDRDRVLDAIQERGYSCQVKTWVCDIADLAALKGLLAEVETFGSLECVLFNAARVAGKPPGEEAVEEIERDFRVSGFLTTVWRSLGPDELASDYELGSVSIGVLGDSTAQEGTC